MSNLSDKHILLIGGCGFIGHNLAIYLQDRGAQVSIIDSLQVNNLLAFQGSNPDIVNRDLYKSILHQRLELLDQAQIPYYIQDARDYHALTKLITKIAPTTIVHLAAISHAGKSNKDPYNTFDHSLRTLENALDATRNSIEHFIYLSSSMVYGDFGGTDVDETSPCSPIGIYGALKLSGELMVKAYHQVFDMQYTIIRPSALYGERCVSRRVGQIFIENAITGTEIKVQGDGSSRLDFTYIGDFCHGIECAITSPNSRNETFNITYGESRSLAQMLDLLKAEFSDLTITHTDWDKLIPERGTLKVDKARELIGYNPQWPLEKGFPAYVNWYRSLQQQGVIA